MLKKTFVLFALGSSLALSHAQVIQFGLSPLGTDNAVGLSPANEFPSVTNSTGSGNLLPGGISFDVTGAMLSFNIGYGSAAGFTDLTGPAVYVNVGSPASTNQIAGEQFDLSSFIIPASDPSKGGTIIGAVGMNMEQSSNLLAGLDYINIYTDANPYGEIRAQLIPVIPNTPPQINGPGNGTLECSDAPLTLTAHVSDAQGDSFEVVWMVNGIPAQTNDISGADSLNGADVTLAARLMSGSNLIEVTATDIRNASSYTSSTIVVRDTTPPVISGFIATPNVLSPPNGEYIPVLIKAHVNDSCSLTGWRIISVASNEPNGSGLPGLKGLLGLIVKSLPDYIVIDEHALLLRAACQSTRNDRVYTITIQARDSAGNFSTPKILTVTVPRGQNNH